MFLTFLLVPLIECADVELLSTRGSFTGAVLASTNTLVLKTPKEMMTFSLEELVEMRFGAQPIEDFYESGIRLHNGDRLSGVISKLENEKLIVETDLFGVVAVPLTPLAGLDFRHAQTSQAKAMNKTHVRLANGDVLPGTLRWLDHASVGVKSSLGLVNVERERTVGVTFEDSRIPHSSGLQVVVRFRSGDRVTGKWKAFKEGQLYLTLPDIGEVHFPVAAVTAALFIGGKSSFLSDMKEDSHVSETFVPGGLPRHFGKDASWSGGPIMLAGRRFEKGISQHSRSRLTYSLDEKCRNFRAFVGIDDEVNAMPGTGDAVCQVFVDGVKKFEQPVRQNEKSIEVNIEVSGGKKLSLVTDFGEGSDAGDRVNWAMARVAR